VESEAFDYLLPEERIAIYPASPRSSARLLHWRSAGDWSHHTVHDLGVNPDLLGKGAQLWHNVSRVIRARFSVVRSTGGVMEVLLLEPLHAPVDAVLAQEGASAWRCMVRGGKRWTGGWVDAFLEGESRLRLELLQVESSGTRLVRLHPSPGRTLGDWLDRLGSLPLPPYLGRSAEPEDDVRYQTIYASALGSVAAPTAGLHFDEEVWAGIQGYASVHAVTLHVGAGTFKPLGDAGVGGHQMHAEQVFLNRSELEALAVRGVRRVAVGTTTLRTLESFFWWARLWRDSGVYPPHLPQWEWRRDSGAADDWTIEDAALWVLEQAADNGLWSVPGVGETDKLGFSTGIMIIPGYRVRSVDALMTNFHQPRSTLLCLVEAFVGPEWRNLYDEALKEGYRFLSFGDSSLLEKRFLG
jgi:S-adenosylmethionine:tRNA ribosyltransferase-isomerase